MQKNFSLEDAKQQVERLVTEWMDKEARSGLVIGVDYALEEGSDETVVTLREGEGK